MPAQSRCQDRAIAKLKRFIEHGLMITPPVTAVIRPHDVARAVRLAREAGSDSLPDEPSEPDPEVDWWYPPAEYELALLGRIVDEGFAASAMVHYSDNYARPAGRTTFRRAIGDDERLIVWRSTGRTTAAIDGIDIAVGTVVGRDERLIPVGGGRIVELTVHAEDGEPAAIGVPRERGLKDPRGWQCAATPEGEWHPALSRAGTSRPPHLIGEPVSTVLLHLEPGGLWAADAPVLGRPVVEGGPRPTFFVGESWEEAAAGPHSAESLPVTIDVGTGEAPRWTTMHPHAIRYLRVDGAAPRSVSVDAIIRPAPRRGAFYSSDDRLNRIWATSAYTLRLCMQGLIVDGIKRDRMPWAGDQALGVLANAYSFADGVIVRDGLVALGRADGYVNGISDYSLWWVVAQEAYLTYFDDRQHALREAETVHAFMSTLAQDVGPDGVLRPAERAGGFAHAGPGSVFIDWGVVTEPGRDSVALQLLWYRALRSASRVLTAADHDGAQRWTVAADETRSLLMARGWDAGAGVWREYLDGRPGGASQYADLLGVLAGLVPTGDEATVAASIARGRFGTPYMRSFALLARVELGDTAGVLADISDSWGRMLDAGAQTFWEEFPDDDSSPLAMYGRPFGRSLCHGWAAGPAALLPAAVLGLKPITDGWREFEVRVELGELLWATAVVPVPHGEIFVTADTRQVRVEIPAGCTLVSDGGDRTTGPATRVWAV